jgi:hypothetical protein
MASLLRYSQLRFYGQLLLHSEQQYLSIVIFVRQLLEDTNNLKHITGNHNKRRHAPIGDLPDWQSMQIIEA